MTTLDPIAAARRVESAYRRYLRTTLRPSDPKLLAAFDRQLARPDQRLGRGPILQAAAPYTTGASIRDLVQAGVLSDRFLEVDPAVLPPDRPLYNHQEEAILKITAGDNAIVATGTGSGKTESFLLPIINGLLHEGTDGSLHQPGVRALLLYPMNALANDQLKRMRQLLASFPDITFGRYTGETKERRQDALALHQQLTGEEQPLPNELISREEIKQRPPHVLISNFAMLEYLLLRPQDSELFDGPFGRHWRFLVLDEVHVYDGAKGAEIAYLLRRLRDRVVQSERGRLTCVGTSATLGAGEESALQVVDFARALFDEPFTPWCLVEPQRRRLDDLSADWTATAQQVEALLEVVNELDPDEPAHAALLVERAADLGCPMVEAGSNVPGTLGRLLGNENTVVWLRRDLASGPRDVTDLEARIRSDVQLVRLVELAWRAVNEDGEPLLPARYHMFLRSLEGAFVCLDPAHPDADPLLLERHLHCPTCEHAGRQRKMFEYGSCRRCGAGYALGEVGATDSHGNQTLVPAPLHEQRLVHLMLGTTPAAEDEDEQVEGDDDLNVAPQTLCVSCGAYGLVGAMGTCCEDPVRIGVVESRPGAQGVVRRCAACGSQSSSNIVFRFLSGADASGSVVASALFQELPPEVPRSGGAVVADRYAGGRKLLAFSDSRQDAAFFANFLERTHDRSLHRRLVWEVLQRLKDSNPGERPRFVDLVPRLVNLAEQFSVFPPNESPLTRSEKAKKWLLAELMSIDVAQTLEGVGLARVSMAVPENLVVPAGLVPEGLSSGLVLELTLALLATLRTRNCLQMPDDVSIDDPLFAPRNFTPGIRLSGSTKRVLAWSPQPSHRNVRLDLVERVFSKCGVETNPREWLESVWGWLSSPQSPWSTMLPASNDGQAGVVRRLRPEHLEFLVEGQHAQPLRCDSCRSITWFHLAGVCTRNGCSGVVATTAMDEEDHYRHLYQTMLPIPAKVQEHTAQLATDEAALRQAAFVRGAVNILSCSTTFELGVDVGEIQAVLMRNVPPGPANYVQRAGRAGRRAGSPALVVTMAQRRNHDQHYFAQPAMLIDGVVQPPVIKVDNIAIARRHVHAVALAAFLRYLVNSGLEEPRTVEDFYEVADGKERSLADEWIQWLETHPEAVGLALRRSMPYEVAVELDFDRWTWVAELGNQPVQGEGGWLWWAQERVRDLIAELGKEMERLKGKSQWAAVDSVDRVRKSIRSTQLLNDLARQVVLPKYGFPVDTVPLDLSRSGSARAARLDLDRDLSVAIVEYGPGSQVVADKVLWESKGVVIPRGLDLETYSWRSCGQCHATKLAPSVGDEAEDCSQCGSSEVASHGRYIIPKYGFIGGEVGAAGDQRPRKGGHTEIHFGDYLDGDLNEPEEVLLNGQRVGVMVSQHGEIRLINRGRAGTFKLCRQCGCMAEVGSTSRKKAANGWKHARPAGGGNCSNEHYELVALGHHYRTDVLELRFGIAASRECYESALHAILAALPDLGVKPGDVDGLLNFYDYGSPPGLLLLDAVPGGAGHAHMLRGDLQRMVNLAWLKASDCACGEDTSCYGCLRSYQNQRIQDQLTRAGAMSVLRPYVTAEEPRRV